MNYEYKSYKISVNKGTREFNIGRNVDGKWKEDLYYLPTELHETLEKGDNDKIRNYINKFIDSKY